jgi:hypothetical protein
MFLFLSEMFNVSYMTAPLLIMLATTKASIPVHQYLTTAATTTQVDCELY